MTWILCYMMLYLSFDKTSFSMYRRDGALSRRCFSAFCFTVLWAWVPVPHLLFAAQSRLKGRKKCSCGVVMKEVLPIALLARDPEWYLGNMEKYRRRGRGVSKWRILWADHKTGVCLCCKILLICSYWLSVCYFCHWIFQTASWAKGNFLKTA